MMRESHRFPGTPARDVAAHITIQALAVVTSTIRSEAHRRVSGRNPANFARRTPSHRNDETALRIASEIHRFVDRASPSQRGTLAIRDGCLQALRDVDRGELVFPAALTRKFLLASSGSLTRTEAQLDALRRQRRILHTKLYRPEVVPDMVARDELLARLEAGRRLPLTLISAPAGYGKSTLVGHWLETSESASAWLSLDEGDSDATTFLRYVIAAVRTRFPAACQDASALLGAVELASARAIARCLAGDLDALEERLTLVLDDYHLIDGVIHELVDHLLRHPSPSLHLAILSRRDPPLALARLRARHQLSEIGLEDLQFEPQQTAALMENALDRSLSGPNLKRLHRLTEGWPVALRLAAVALRRASTASSRSFSSTGSKAG